MAQTNKILVAEDEISNQLLVKRTLSKAGFTAVVVNNGIEVLQILEREQFDAIITDWMMPEMDGIELIRTIRKKYKEPPFILMMTSLASESARRHALEVGADDFIAKPVNLNELLERVQSGIARQIQVDNKFPIQETTVRPSEVIPNSVAIAIAASTGGPPTVLQVLKGLDPKANTSIFIVQHGPAWMLESFAQKLNEETDFTVRIASNLMPTQPGFVYIAPGEFHMRVDKNTYRIQLDDGPKENFVRPAADPLFRSVADAYGKFSVGVVLTGLGRDGTQGISHIHSVKGSIIVQDPETAIASSMPSSALTANIPLRKEPLDKIAAAINERVFALSALLKKVKGGAQ